MSNPVKQENILNYDFASFLDEMKSSVRDAIENFWEEDVELQILALSEFRNIRDEYFLKGSDFFSSQIKVENHKPVVIRFCDKFVEMFLTSSLADSGDIFNLKKMTALEVKIFNSFCEFLYKQFEPLLLSAKDVKVSAASEKNYNFLFVLRRMSGDSGGNPLNTSKTNVAKILISIPQDRLNLSLLEHTAAFDDDDFLRCAVKVRVRVGYSKLTLEELQNLNADDTILLEDSSLSFLTLVSGDIEHKFRVEGAEDYVEKIDDDENIFDAAQDGNTQTYNTIDEVAMKKNLWDDIQIELSAEFSKVKMTIGELKQITRGQIVDLGSIFENEISLYIEDKKVAKGELIIINDKYAVKLNEVLNSNIAPSDSNAQNTATQQEDTNIANADAASSPKPEGQPAQQNPAAVQGNPRTQTGAQNPQAQPAAQNPQTAAQNNPNASPKPSSKRSHAVVEDEEFDYSDFEN